MHARNRFCIYMHAIDSDYNNTISMHAIDSDYVIVTLWF